jgi:2-polyprenyl-3-methyl-5-hydroxy-6-metoxy-1,4-benzoquinol methylase
MREKPQNYDFANIYSEAYSLGQTKKFLLRNIDTHNICNWKIKQQLFCDEIIEKLDLNTGSVFLDLGCNIGTYAIEMASRGWKTVGVDLSDHAIEAARVLAARVLKENRPKFLQGDVSDASLFEEGSFDVIMAEDIFEHLHEELLIKALNNCYRWLKAGGYMMFHTCPTKYDYLFHSRGWKSTVRLLPLVPFTIHGERKFKRAVSRYHRLVGRKQAERIINDAHCNLLTTDHLAHLINTSGLVVLTMKTANLYELNSNFFRRLFFSKREYFHRNLFGVAWKPLPKLFRTA